MHLNRNAAIILLRFAMAATFLSAVASRLGLWGNQSSRWSGFLQYAREVLSYAPIRMIPGLAIGSTILESVFGILLLLGFKTRWISCSAAILTLLFALSMTYSQGVKSALDYSVFVDSAACLLLSGLPADPWSLDSFLSGKGNITEIFHQQKQ